jgi:putative acetyltransferase
MPSTIANGVVTVHPEPPRQPEVTRLVEALDAYLTRLYPPERNHRLDVEALSALDVRFFVARLDGHAVGCGALRLDGRGYGEVKRVWVDPAMRGRKIGRAIVVRLEDEARASGLALLRLETGVHQPEALALYRSAGYREIAAFGDYGPEPLSVFMEKAIR